MRRAIALATAAVIGIAGPVALTSSASAATHEYVTLNAKGLNTALVKKMLAPRWFGQVADSKVTVDESKGSKPIECDNINNVITTTKSSSFATSFIDYKQSKPQTFLDTTENLWQYKDVSSAQYAWKVFNDSVQACAGTWDYTFTTDDGKTINTKTVITVSEGVAQYNGVKQIIVNQDVQYDGDYPGDKAARTSADQLSIWSWDGMALIEFESNKYVPKYKKWTFSDPQVATIEALQLLAAQRYHLAAYKTI